MMNRAPDAAAVAMPPASARTGENRAINVIRVIAALLVVVCHVRSLLFEDYNPHQHAVARLLYATTELGPQAVIVFFVLSGYWVGGGALAKLRAATFTWRSYASSRLTRLWLVLIPAMLLTLAVDQIGRHLRPVMSVYDGTKYPDVFGLMSWSPGTFLGNAFFLQTIAVDDYGTDSALWSLANEFWYYLIFPAALMVFMRAFSMRARCTAAVIAIGGAVVAGPAILALFPAWLVGAAIAWQRERITALVVRTPARALVVARIAAGAATFGAMVLTALVTFRRFGGLPIALPAAVLVCLLIVDVTARKGVGGRLLTGGSWLAGSSYSLYVIHLPLAVLISEILVPGLDDRWVPDVPHVLAGLGVMVVLITAGACFATVTERRTETVRAFLRRCGARWTVRRRGGDSSVSSESLALGTVRST